MEIDSEAHQLWGVYLRRSPRHVRFITSLELAVSEALSILALLQIHAPTLREASAHRFRTPRRFQLISINLPLSSDY